MKLSDAMGWAGVGCILVAYFLVTFKLIDPASVAYGTTNMLGACGIIWSSYVKKDFQPVVLNVVWLLIAIVGLARVVIS